MKTTEYYVHPSSAVDEGARIGVGTRIWHFSHVSSGARIGEHCVLGQNVFVSADSVVGNHVKIQNNVSVYGGVTIEDYVFLGPSCVLTNVPNPRSEISRHALYDQTVLRRGCSVGANATIVCGVTIGRYAFIGAGAVVTRNVPDYALVTGVPARQHGWMSRHGQPLPEPDEHGIMVCPESGLRYRENQPGTLRCLDVDEEQPLPGNLATAKAHYRDLKKDACTAHRAWDG